MHNKKRNFFQLFIFCDKFMRIAYEKLKNRGGFNSLLCEELVSCLFRKINPFQGYALYASLSIHNGNKENRTDFF